MDPVPVRSEPAQGLVEFSFPIAPDFVLTSERDVFRARIDRKGWEPFGDWNETGPTSAG